MGSGLKSVPLNRLINAINGVFQAAIPGRFKIATQAIPLSEVERAWTIDDSKKRTVFVPAQK
jgi:hypothetical protein